MKVYMEQDILQENDDQADENRLLFGNTLVVNIIGSPGCGKTTLLEKTIEALKDEYRLAVIEGDIYTTKDSERIEKFGIPSIQINTAGGCHLSAEITSKAASDLDLDDIDILFIENVGNLVCPAEFDLGEDSKVAVLSVVEGDDKPAKYPLLFSEAGAVLLTKTDLLPYTNFDKASAEKDIRALNGDAPIYEMNVLKGEGMDKWLDWLRVQHKAKTIK
ncbi:MAG: hydrogenase nickel incorporation protein HypB [Anaerovoracaceae bacterium]|nr:hydrogenase nickel incorporation protein HypB [Bacillota bacterium]MDY2671198.1 hydrogenase nickel incorporation protein HypB [Anaerovoracaceae bacterium]